MRSTVPVVRAVLLVVVLAGCGGSQVADEPAATTEAVEETTTTEQETTTTTLGPERQVSDLMIAAYDHDPLGTVNDCFRAELAWSAVENAYSDTATELADLERSANVIPFQVFDLLAEDPEHLLEHLAVNVCPALG